MDIEQKFWSYIDRSGEHWFYVARQWIGRGTLFDMGPGLVGIDGRRMQVHRWAYILTYGEIPPGLLVRHRCGWGGCCNPTHLLLGTHAENAWDLAVRQRRQIDRDTLYTYEDDPDWRR